MLYQGASLSANAYGGIANGYGNAPWPNTPSDKTWNTFESHTGKKVAVVAVHQNFTVWDPSPVEHAYSRGAFSLQTVGLESGASIAAINSGSWDAKIDAFAAQLAAYKRPIMIRPWWEFNGNWGYPWQTSHGTTPAAYAQAWRRFRTRCDAKGATNLTWVWCPNIWSGSGGPADPLPWYPGSQFVDWIGLDGYNKGTGSQSFDSLYSHAYAELQKYMPTKPIIVCEIASHEFAQPSIKANWITDTLTRIPTNYPKIKGLLWYNDNNGSYQNGQAVSGPLDTFPIETRTTVGGVFTQPSLASAAYAKGIASSNYIAAPAAGWKTGKVLVP